MAVTKGTLSTTMDATGWVLSSQAGGVTTADLHTERLGVKETDVGHCVVMVSMLDLEASQTQTTF